MQNSRFNKEQCVKFVQQSFTQSALPSLMEYIKIPNLSRAFDPQWHSNGLLQNAASHIKKWVDNYQVEGATCQIIKFEGLSPIIFTEVKGQINQTIFFYGHYDKQPPMVGWDADLAPCKPVLKDDKLYGRGGADDGYATYGTLMAIKTLQKQGIPLPRCVMITEGDEESGSVHMNTYLPKLKEKIGNPTVIFCLDSGVLDYERLWVTNSLRGMVSGRLRVEVMTEGVHSGDSSGIVPSAFRIIRELLQRLESAKTGDLHQAFQVDIPANRYQEMYELVQLKKQDAIKQFPFSQGVRRVWQNPMSAAITRGWKAQMAIIGASGLPQCENAGNVTLPFNQVKISIRLPPTKNPKQAQKEFVRILTEYPPYNAKVTVSDVVSATGFNAPQYSSILEDALKQASSSYYNNDKLSLCEGMSIPLLGLMNQLWPKAQFVVTGVLGPKSNAHGPNQFLHIPYVKKLICCMAHVLARLSENRSSNK